MKANKPIISIIVPAYNEEQYIGQCLRSIFNNSLPLCDYEVIVVDNGSCDSTIAIAKTYDITLYIEKDTNVGGVRNYGAERANGEILVFLDSDCVVAKDWLKIISLRKNMIESVVYGGQYLLRKNASWLERHWVLNDNSLSIEQTTLVGGCIVISKNIFDKASGFNENMLSGEDSDLTYRLKKLGYRVEIDPHLSVVHLGYPSSVISFLRRQIWHSLDYVNNFPRTMNDKVFLITLTFLSGFVVIFSSLFFDYLSFFWGFFLISIATSILSLKRIIRSENRSFTLRKVVSIFAVDFIYLSGRSLGVISGIIRLFGFRFLYFKKG